jgi:hypothetical protein
MEISGMLERASLESWTDQEVVERIRAGAAIASSPASSRVCVN